MKTSWNLAMMSSSMSPSMKLKLKAQMNSRVIRSLITLVAIWDEKNILWRHYWIMVYLKSDFIQLCIPNLLLAKTFFQKTFQFQIFILWIQYYQWFIIEKVPESWIILQTVICFFVYEKQSSFFESDTWTFSIRVVWWVSESFMAKYSPAIVFI